MDIPGRTLRVIPNELLTAVFAFGIALQVEVEHRQIACNLETLLFLRQCCEQLANKTDAKFSALSILERSVDCLKAKVLAPIRETLRHPGEEVLACLLQVCHLRGETRTKRFPDLPPCCQGLGRFRFRREDRKSTRLNSSHVAISYAVFCLKK